MPKTIFEKSGGKLNTCLVDIDKQAQERFERLIGDMKKTQGITERLKEENALQWTGRMHPHFYLLR